MKYYANRPISVLTSFCKMFENDMYKGVIYFLNSAVSSHRKNVVFEKVSTVKAVYKSIDKISYALNDKTLVQVSVILSGFAKVFDYES
jgi:hypothetical protein